jgi:hypothetical protein
MSTQLTLHRGAQTVDRSTLFAVPAPEPTETWFPVAHGTVLETAERLLQGAGFEIERSRYGLTADGHRFFGVLDLRVRIGDGQGIGDVTLAVGLRNSTDKSFPIGLAAGTRVFVCDNLAFSAELVVTRRHTKNGMERWTEGIGGAVGKLDEFRGAESRRIEVLSGYQLGLTEADSLLLRAYETGILSYRQLPEAIRQWRNPTFDWGREGTAWHLYNAMTTALSGFADSNPQRHAGLTMKLMQHFSGIVGSDGAALALPGTVDRLTDTGEHDPVHLRASDGEIVVPDTERPDGLAEPNRWDFID